MRDGVPVIYWYGETNRVRRGGYYLHVILEQELVLAWLVR